MAGVAVVGAGTMGHALALVFALGGHRVRLTDSHAPTLAGAEGQMNTALATLVETGEADKTWTPKRLAESVTRHDSLAEALAGAELVIEAIIEQPEEKRILFGRIAELADDAAIIASNTSSLDIFPLVPERLKPRTMIGHWYAPPYLVDLVDVVPGEGMQAASVDWFVGLVRAMGKFPVVLKKFVPGYVANRIQEVILIETLRLIDEGVATAQQIDDSVIHGLALRMPILGVMCKADFSGLDVIQSVVAHRTEQPPKDARHSATLDGLVAQGRTGVKGGRGFFDWTRRDQGELARDRDRRLIALKQQLRKIVPIQGD
jgi:3-hydroxybutyryl-CoA dehydrogenase